MAASDFPTNSDMAATIQELRSKKSFLIFAAMLFTVRGLRNCSNNSNLLRVNGTATFGPVFVRFDEYTVWDASNSN